MNRPKWTLIQFSFLVFHARASQTYFHFLERKVFSLKHIHLSVDRDFSSRITRESVVTALL